MEPRGSRRFRGSSAKNRRAKVSSQDKNTRSPEYPRRSGEKPCSHYMRTGFCRYGSSCKFDHPPRPQSQQKPRRSDFTKKTGPRTPPKKSVATPRDGTNGKFSFKSAKGERRYGDGHSSSQKTPPRQHRRRTDNNSPNHAGRNAGMHKSKRGRSKRQTSKLRNWFECCIKNGNDFKRRDGGRNFLSAAVTEFTDDGSDLLYRLVAPDEFGDEMLKKAIEKVSQERHFVTKSVLPFIERLAQKDTCAGPCAECS